MFDPKISCPKCLSKYTEYQDEHSLSIGSNMKCCNCGYKWYEIKMPTVMTDPFGELPDKIHFNTGAIK